MSGLQVRLVQDGPIPLDAEFDCPRGQLLALVGPSGSGKSTILRSIAGLYRPHTGRVACDGRLLLDTAAGIDLAPQQRQVGVVFQDYALFPHLSALDNVRLALQRLAEPERTQTARDWLTRVRLNGLEARRPGALSGGEQQRVALARALARDPAVLLLDEPFSAVDQVTRHRLRLELAELSRGLEVPIVLVTHDLDEASMLGDRLCVLHHGRTLQQGRPAEVVAAPATAQVARLIDIRNIHVGILLGHAPDGTWSEIDWGGHRLKTRYAPLHAVGARVSWCVNPNHVLLIPAHVRRDDGENGFDTKVAGLLTGSGVTQALLELDDGSGVLFHMDLPTRVAIRHRLAVGVPLKISLPREALHVMAATADDGRPWRESTRVI